MDFTQFKFGNFEIGQKIKAFDFQPMSDRPDRYIVGTIVNTQKYPFAGYIVKVEEDSAFKKDLRTEVTVPMEVDFMEYDTRVTLVE